MKAEKQIKNTKTGFMKAYGRLKQAQGSGQDYRE